MAAPAQPILDHIPCRASDIECELCNHHGTGVKFLGRTGLSNQMKVIEGHEHICVTCFVPWQQLFHTCPFDGKRVEELTATLLEIASLSDEDSDEDDEDMGLKKKMDLKADFFAIIQCAYGCQEEIMEQIESMYEEGIDENFTDRLEGIQTLDQFRDELFNRFDELATLRNEIESGTMEIDY